MRSEISTIIMKLLLSIFLFSAPIFAKIPIVINTWKFQQATLAAWEHLLDTKSAVGALELGCKVCQDLQCDFTVGFGGSPDENGETTLDAMIFDGSAMDMGAVGGLRNVKDAISVARNVLENTEHSILVGSLATEFAVNLKYSSESLQTNYSLNIWDEWKNNSCQPNFWKNVLPDPKTHCGPYNIPDQTLSNEITETFYSSTNHDTIGMIVISEDGHVVAGASSNGATHKIPGRVGDAPLPGAGAYADSEVGAAAATGDGDVMMRFLPSFVAVEQMRLGTSPTKAAREAISRIARKYPEFFGGVIAVNKEGIFGAACNGMDKFPYSVANGNQSVAVVTKYVSCINKK